MIGNDLARQTQLTWKQGLFAHRIPYRFRKCSRVWTLLRGSITWFLWKERNEVVFQDKQANAERVCQQVWANLIDYGTVAWDSTRKKAGKQQGNGKKKKLILDFQKIWCKEGVLATWENDKPVWKSVQHLQNLIRAWGTAGTVGLPTHGNINILSCILEHSRR